tara:strand:- start:160 stop:1506 length:1347 start_codon:yes stop_codon:yes gene_type:complete
MSSTLNNESILLYRNNFSKRDNNVALNSVSNNNLNDVALNRENYQQISHIFSHRVKNEGKVTNQKSSGRCWIFAALNMMRLPTMEKYNLENDFEFSQSYVFFWDKLERCNYFLECIYNTIESERDSREIKHLLTDPLCDGGQWDMFVNIVEKYGLVPKSVYNESHNSSNSRRMNWVLTYKLREYACIIREKSENGSKKELKDKFMSEIYEILCIFLGEPPSKFNWEYYDKNKEYHRVKGMTPLEFYNNLSIKCNDYYCLIHDPRNEYNKCYSVKYLGNVVEGRKIKYINLPIEKIKKYAVKSIKENESVWFGCDVGKWFERKKCVMDTDVFNYEEIFNTEFGLNKRERLNYGESLMTHAMLFTGLDCEEENNTVKNETETIVNKWRVENSWSESGPAKGYYIMTDKWFDEYVYEVVLHKKHLNEGEIRELNEGEVKTFPPWDPFGALA